MLRLLKIGNRLAGESQNDPVMLLFSGVQEPATLMQQQLNGRKDGRCLPYNAETVPLSVSIRQTGELRLGSLWTRAPSLSVSDVQLRRCPKCSAPAPWSASRHYSPEQLRQMEDCAFKWAGWAGGAGCCMLVHWFPRAVRHRRNIAWCSMCVHIFIQYLPP